VTDYDSQLKHEKAKAEATLGRKDYLGILAAYLPIVFNATKEIQSATRDLRRAVDDLENHRAVETKALKETKAAADLFLQKLNTVRIKQEHLSEEISHLEVQEHNIRASNGDRFARREK